MPLHVADAPHGLQLGSASAKLVEVLELALLQQVLAATVSGELVADPAGQHRALDTCERGGVRGSGGQGSGGQDACVSTHVPQLTAMLPTLSVKP